MKIIFSKDFKDKLSQPNQKIIFNKYFIGSLEEGSDILQNSNISFNVLENSNLVRDLQSIWDNDLKTLSLSLKIEDPSDKNLLLEENNIAYISIMYTTDDRSNSNNVAFILIGDDLSNTEDEYKPGKLGFSTIMNLVNIDLSNIPIVAEVDTNQSVLTDSTKFLESPIDIGNNIYLLKPDDIVTISIDSFRKKLFRDKCEDLNTNLIQDYLRSDTGERIYRNMVLRMYNPNAFYPKLVGDAVIITSEGERVVRTTTTDLPNTVEPEVSLTTTTTTPTENNPVIPYSLKKYPDLSVIEFNTLGLSYLGGKINIVGLVGYHDYIIKNNKIIEYSSGYQNITEIPGLIIKEEQLFDKDGKAFSEIDLDITGKTIIYKKSNHPEKTYGKKLIINLPSIIINSGNISNKINVDLYSCRKEFKLKQSNDFDVPWSLEMPSNVEIGYEYESTKKGLSLYPVPVIIFNSDGKTNDNTDFCKIKLVSTDSLVLNGIDGLKVSFEYSEGYSTAVNSAETEFNRFFDLGKPEETKNGYLFKITCKNYNDATPPNMWIPVSENMEQLLIKCKLSMSIVGGEFFNGSDTFETPFYVVRKPQQLKKLNIYEEEFFNPGDFTGEEGLSSLYLKKSNESFNYTTEPLNFVAKSLGMPETTSKISNSMWILSNPNYPNLTCNLDTEDIYYGALTLDTKFGYYEYSKGFRFNYTSGESNNSLENITFNYIDEDIFSKKEISNLINNFDINDWKSTILMTKLDLPVIKQSELKASFETISFNVDQCEIKTIKASSNDMYLQEGGVYTMNIGRLGDHIIKIIPDENFSVSFIKENYIGEDVILIGSGNYLNEETNILLRVNKIDLTKLPNKPNNKLGTITIKQSENSYIKINVITSLTDSNYLKNLHKYNLSHDYYMSPIDPIINCIFLSGYKYCENKEVCDISRDDMLDIKYTSPITTLVTGTVVSGSTTLGEEDGNDCLILGTIYNEDKGWGWHNYITKFGLGSLGFHTYSKEDYDEVIIGSTFYDSSNNYMSSKIYCSSRLVPNNKNKYHKYPIPKIGEIRTHILGTNDYNLTYNTADDLINYSVFKRGLRPSLHNTYNHNELKDADIYIVDNTNKIEDGYYKETIIYPIESLYPLSTSTSTSDIKTFSVNILGTLGGYDLDLGSLTCIDPNSKINEYFGFGTGKSGGGYTDGWEMNDNPDPGNGIRYYKNKISAINFLPINATREQGSISDQDKYQLGSISLCHYLPNTKIFDNSITDNLLSADIDISFNRIIIESEKPVTSDITVTVEDNFGNIFNAKIITGSNISYFNPTFDISNETVLTIKNISPYLDNTYNYYSSDVYYYVEKPFNTTLNVYWVGKKWADISLDTSVISIMGGEKQVTLHKPHIYSAVPDDSTRLIIGSWDFDSTNNSTIDFSIDIEKYTEAIDLVKNTPEPIDLVSLSTFWNDYRKLENNKINLKFTINNEFDVTESVEQEKPSDSIFYKDSNSYKLFIRDINYGLSLGNTLKEVSHNTKSISFTLLGISIDDVSEFNKSSYSISGNPVSIEKLNETDTDVIIYINENVTELNQNSENNITIEFNENNKNAKREIPLKISYKGISFTYTIIQDAYNPELRINGCDVSVYLLGDVIEDSNIILGFHSSGNFLNNGNNSEFGYVIVESNNLSIYNKETNQLNLEVLGNEDIGLEHYVIEHSSNSYTILLKISPNYSRKIRTGTLVLKDLENEHVWYLGFKQGYITTSLSPNSDLNSSYDLVWNIEENKYLGTVGTEDNPFLYPSGNVTIEDRYFYVQIIQREIYYRNNTIYISDEYLISSNYDNINKVPKSIKLDNKYTTVTYQADPWTSTVEGGISRVFKEGSYDTDLYYYPGEEQYYPRLVHRYKVTEGYGEDELVFNIQTRFAISRYKKYLNTIDDTDNLDSEILYLNNTPFQFSFWLKKSGNENSLPIEILDEDNNKVSGAINFSGEPFETKNVIIKLGSDLKLLEDIDIITSDSWLDFSVDYVKNVLSIVCRINDTGNVRNGVITLIPKDPRWSGIKSIDIRQNVPKTALLVKDPIITLTGLETSLYIIQYSSVPLFIDSFGFSTEVDWISEFTPNSSCDDNEDYCCGSSIIIPEDFSTFDFDNRQWRWLFKILPNNTGTTRYGNIAFKLSYRTSPDGELINWKESIDIIQLSNNETTTTITPPIECDNDGCDNNCDLICY